MCLDVPRCADPPTVAPTLALGERFGLVSSPAEGDVAPVATASNVQVRESINRAGIGRWKNYAEQLAPILPILEPFVTEFGYEPS